MQIKNIKSDVIGNDEFLEILKFSHYNPTKEKLSRLSQKYANENDIYPFAAFDKDKMIGFIVVQDKGSEVYEIIDIAVNENYRKLGIASKLIDYIKENFDIKTLYAETDNDAIGFYKKYGFVVSDTKQIESIKRYKCYYKI